MEIPVRVREAMKDEMDRYKGSIIFLGVYKGESVN